MNRCLLMMFAACMATYAQTPPEKARITGTVTNAVTGQPVRRAHVALSANGQNDLTAVADSQGKFAIADIPVGKFELSASHDGYLMQVYGAKKPGSEHKGTAIELSAGDIRTKMDLLLTPLGAIFGHIRDEDGDPVRQVNVTVLAYKTGPEGPKLQTLNGTQTDASGEYRVFDLEPGKYYVRATPMSAMNPGPTADGEAFATVYYPGAREAATAAPIEVVAGQEQRGIDLVLRPIATAHIRGRVVRPAGANHCGVHVEQPADAESAESSDGGDFTGATLGGFLVFSGSVSVQDSAPPEDQIDGDNVGRDGKFELLGLPVGSHILVARCRVTNQQYQVKLAIELGRGGLENLDLRPLAPSSISGTVRIEGETERKVTETHVSMSAAPNVFLGPPPGDADGIVRENGDFHFRNLDADVHRLKVQPPPGLYLKSVTSNGRAIDPDDIDLTAGGTAVSIEVLLSANGGTIEGSVENGAGAAVVLIPNDGQAARPRARQAVVAKDGRFSIAGVAPGRYMLFAWEPAETGSALYDATFRKPFESKAQRVEISEKQKTTVQMQVISTPDR